MKHPPRKLKPLAALRSGQRTVRPSQPRANSSTTIKQNAQNARRRDAKERAMRRQQSAAAALLDAADDVRSLDDLARRAEIQATIADVLWPFDEASARAIFARAWEAATDADTNAREKNERESREQAPRDSVPASDSQRFSLLPIITKHDTQLADRFLRNLVREDAQYEESSRADSRAESPVGDAARDAPSQAERRRRSPWRELDSENRRRLELAGMLLEDGQDVRAASVVAPLARTWPSAELIEFLLDFRSQAPREADEIYRQLLEATGANAGSDANDVLLLSTYIKSPRLIVVVDEHGTPQFRTLPLYAANDGRASTAEISPYLLRLFYKLAATVLLRPMPAVNARGANSVDAAIAPFFAISHLIPSFALEARQYVPALQARRAALSAEIEAPRREQAIAQADVRALSQNNPSDYLQPLSDKLAGATSEAERDRVRLIITRQAAERRMWERARRTAAEIVDEQIRRVALTAIAVQQIVHLSEAYDEDEADAFERAATFVRGADVPHAFRAWGYAQVAGMASHTHANVRAAELLSEAINYARQAEAGGPRVAALGVVTIAAAHLDAGSAWEILQSLTHELVEITPHDSASSVDEGSGALIDMREYAPEEVFAAMARLDFARALAEARSLKREASRAIATVAVARSVLDKRAQVNDANSAR